MGFLIEDEEKKTPSFKHSFEVLAKHTEWIDKAIKATKALMYYDRNLVRLEERVVPQIVMAEGKRGDHVCYLRVTLGRNSNLHEITEMGCHSGYFIPAKQVHTYKRGEPLPNMQDPPPDGWVPLSQHVQKIDSTNDYQIEISNSSLGVSGQEGLLVMRPNTGNDILYRRLELLKAYPEWFPLHLATKVFNSDERSVRYSGNAESDRLLPEQLECVRFFQSNETTYIWGPPGTGKSVTLTAIISECLKQKLRVLVLATMNDAIDAISEKLHLIYVDCDDEYISSAVEAEQITRYGATDRTRRYPELSFTMRQKRKRITTAARDNMVKDQVSLTTMFRFLLQDPVNYDVVIVDEVGAVNLPLNYCAAACGAKKMVVCGDPKQNTPIFKYTNVHPPPSNEVKILFSRDIYKENNFRLDPAQEPDSRVCRLETQFRMVDPLARKVRLLNLYPSYKTSDRRVTSPTDRTAIMAHPKPGKAFVLLDTSALPSPRNAENSNQEHFELGKVLSSYYSSVSGLGHIGIVTPYKRQATLYTDWIKRSKIHKITAGTVHRFQGSEATLMIVDTVESPPIGTKPNSHAFTDEIRYEKSSLGTANNLNVAFSRARAKCVLMMNVDYVRANLTNGCFLHRVIEDCALQDEIIPAHVFLNALGLSLGRTESMSNYFEREPHRVLPADFNRILSSDVKSARVSIGICSKTVDRNFIYQIVDWLYKRTVADAISITLYLPGNMKKAEKQMIDDLISVRPTVQVQPYTLWTKEYGHGPFIVFDNGRLIYESQDGGDVNYLAGQVPVVTHRFSYSNPIK